MSIEENTINSEIINSEENESNPMNYKVIVDLINEMEDQYKTLKSLGEETIHAAYDLKPETLIDIIPITENDIKEMSKEDATKFLKAHKYNININDEHDPLEVMDAVKETSLNILSAKIEADNIRKDSKEVLEEYFNYASSSKAKEIRIQRLNTLKEAVEKESDEGKKRKMMREINAMEASQTLSFIFERFNSIGSKEIKSIKNAFFDSKLGKEIVDRYKKKIIKFGFDHKLYRYFLNLEENFLEEEYHCFNNLFLFIFMRAVVHYDPYNKTDKLYVQAMVTSMTNLIYHRFDSTTSEDNFISIIRKVVSYFDEYREYFKENNETAPDHPTRIESDNRYNKERRELLINKMNEMKITDYDPNASADELQQYLNDSLEKMIKEQLPEKKEENDENDVDDSVTDDAFDKHENLVIDNVE